MDTEYLPRLTARLADGLARRPADFRARHARFIRAAQQPDGGFPGREGGSDLYYTAFALRGLVVLGEADPATLTRTAAYLSASRANQAGVVDFFSFLYACALVQAAGGPDVLADSPPDWPDRVAAALESLRTPDGGYGKLPGASAGSTYHTFLVGLCYGLLARPYPDPVGVVNLIRGRRRDDGGYVEVTAMRRSGTNPTAAAVGVLRLTESLTDPERADAIEYLAEMPSDEGGMRANGRVPLADLLSTFTGLWTLADLGGLDRIDTAAALRYARLVEKPSGGFTGGLWDEGTDVEYTFYGLGVIGLFRDE